jgi:hypothetical protein
MQDIKVTPIQFKQTFQDAEMYRGAADMLNRAAQNIAPPPQAGSAPIVMVRTIEQTRKDQAWEAEELARKQWRKIEAFKATLGTEESEFFASIVAAQSVNCPPLEANKHAVGLINANREARKIANSPPTDADNPQGQSRTVIDLSHVQPLSNGDTIEITHDGEGNLISHRVTYEGEAEEVSGIALAAQADTTTIADAERIKYEKMWQFEQYRAVAPGEGIASRFMDIAKPKAGSEVIDFGAGTGRGALMLAIMGMKVKMLDFATNCLDEDVRNALTTQAHVLSFAKQDLRKSVPHVAEYGYCTDVMEHIEPSQVTTVVGNILRSAQHVFFQISCVDDVCGALIGEPLHLSVHPYAWWHDLFTQLGCVFHWSKDEGDSCLFYVSGWIKGKDMVDVGVLNITMEQVRANVEHNMNQGWQQVSPHATNDTEVMILGSGPSLGRSLEDIRRLKAEGVKIITLNGAYQWCRQNDLLPVNQVVVDARPFNDRFTRPVEEGCNYFIASQCDPSVLEGLPKDRTWLWHTTAESIKDILDKHEGVSWGIPGGSTVLLRAIPMFRMLGFTKFHLFGCDSCCDEDGAHHTTLQPENNNTPFPVIVGGRQFLCHPDQFSQAQEFMDLIKMMGNVIELEVYGNGLLAWILKTGASLADSTATPTADEEFVL